MRIASFGAAVLAATFLSAPLAAQQLDGELAALTDKWYDYQLAEYRQIEQADGTTDWGDTYPSVTPAAYKARADHARATLAKLDAMDSARFSPTSRIDAEVFRTLLEEQIGDAQFREWEMPFDSDSDFWSYLAARRPLANAEDYRRYIARIRDISTSRSPMLVPAWRAGSPSPL